MECLCAILAGGASTRMGRDKATIVINGKTLIEHVYDSIKDSFDDVIVISNKINVFAHKSVRVYKDILPIQSTLTGIVSALIHSHKPYVFIVACDMPNISHRGIEYMLENINGEDIIIPRTEKGFEPLHAIYSKSCITYMLSLIEKRIFRITALFPYVNVRILEETPFFINNGHSVFVNINKEEDLILLKKDNHVENKGDGL